MALETSPTARLLDTATDVETPEHIRFRYQLAGPARRAFAYVIDLVVQAGVMLALFLAAGAAGLVTMQGVSQGFLYLAIFAIDWGYYVLFESLWNGTTPGK